MKAVSYTHLDVYKRQPDPGPEEIVIDTIDRSRPVMDDILHSAADNAPAGMFGYPHFLRGREACAECPRQLD